MNITRLSVLSLVFLSCVLSLRGQDFRGAFHIEQQEFRESNDSVFLRFRFRVDSHAVPSCSSVVFEPELMDESGNRFTFPYVLLTGEDRTRLHRRWFSVCSDRWLSGYTAPYLHIPAGRYAGQTLDYAVSAPYRDWMACARLVLRQETAGCAGELHLLTYTLANHIALSARDPYTVRPSLALVAPGEEVKTRRRQGSAFLDFQVNRSDILHDFRRNPVELGKINDVMLDVMSNPDVEITGFFIEGYASPEGTYANNDRLARGRATALKDYIRTRYQLPDALFTVRAVAEDWEGLRTRVEEGNDLPRKDEILSIIDSPADPDVKEQRLKQLNIYSRLLRDVFPELRRVEYQIDYSVRNYSNTEAKDLLRSHPEHLSHAELYRVAESYGQGSAEYNRILIETIPAYYGDDPVALNNAAALLIECGELNTAFRLLTKARDLPAAWNNLGVVYLLQGHPEQAEELLDRASLAGVGEALHNRSELAKKREDNARRAKQ